MNRLHSSLLSAAVTGLFVGGAGSLGGCATDKGADKASAGIAEKHACKGLNSCSGKGGCKTGDAGCAGKNSCRTKGGCATVAHHSCGGKNACSGQGGCKSGDRGCAGKNTCNGKGGCAVPVKH